MATNLKIAKQRILNKWNWDDPSKSYPVILWGAPGIGKTQLIYSLICERIKKDLDEKFLKAAQEISDKESEEYKKLQVEYERKLKILNFDSVTHELLELISPHCLVLRLAERPIEQITGVVVPSLSNDQNFARFVMPENLVKAKESEFGIIFLDELDKCSDAKFGAATHILENKVVGDLQLGPGWYVIAAANREEDSHLSNPIPPEIRNRCANIEVEHDVNVWIEWALQHNVRNEIIMFHRFNNGNWLAQYDLKQTYAFPTPRSWTMVSTIIDRIEKQLKVDYNNVESVEKFNNIVRNELIDFVGAQAAAEFFTYRELYLKFSIKEILDGTKRVPRIQNDTQDSSIISDQCIAAFAMASQITPDMLGKKEDYKFICYNDVIKNFVQFINDLAPEIRTIFLQMIHKTRILNILVESGQAEDIIEEIIQYIAAV